MFTGEGQNISAQICQSESLKTESVCKIEETKDVLSFVAIGASKIDSIGLFTAVFLCKSIFCFVFRKILQSQV